MWINGYKIVGWIVTSLSMASRLSQVDTLVSWTCGVGLKNIHPYLGVASTVAFYTAEPTKQIVNWYWQNGFRNQSDFSLSSRESCKKKDWVLVENKSEPSYWEFKEEVNREWTEMKLKHQMVSGLKEGLLRFTCQGKSIEQSKFS